MINDIKTRNSIISKLELKLRLGDSILFFLKNAPNPYEYKELDFMRSKFIRYSLRSIFFLKKYNNELKRIYKKIENDHGFEKRLKIRIEDDIYHFFDAAIVFSKSITEKGKILNPDLITNHEIKKIFIQKMISWKKQLDYLLLSDIRNEIIHLNNNGTSLDSWVSTHESSSGFKLLTFLNNDYDLNEYFNQTFELIISVIDDSLGLIVSEYIYLYDVKSIDKHIIIDKKKIKLNDLKLCLNKEQYNSKM